MRPSHLQSPVLPTEQPQEGSVLTDQIFQYEMQAPVNLENVEKTWQSPGYNAFAACQSQSVAIESVQQTPQYYLYQDNVHIDDSMMENKVVEQLQPAPFTFEGAIGKLMQVPVHLENVQKTWQLYPYNAYAASQNQSVGMNQGYVHFEDSIMENNTVKQQEPNRLTFEEAIEKFNEWKLKNQETLNLEIENINVDILLFNKNGTRQVPQKIRKFSNSYYFHLFFKKSKEDKENWDVYYRLKWMKAYQKISQCQEELQKMGLVD
uniref:CUT domain-containing protein n=1 Tax=Caenorhabditis tropicalis TaxID=1561998 RepID=A0A1I7UET5_9PELO